MVVESILTKVAELFRLQVDKIADYGELTISLLALFLSGYIFGITGERILKKILHIERVEDAIIKHGVMKSSAWERTINFLAFYVKWFITVMVLTLIDMPLITQKLYPFMSHLFWFILLLLLGLTIGGVASKFIKDFSMDFGWDEKLVKYGLADALGEISITSVLAGIVKWYIVLIFVLQGVEQLKDFPVLVRYMEKLIVYIPEAVVGIIIMILSLMIADYTNDRIKQRKIDFAEALALSSKIIIVFFGLVVALPRFGIKNITIIEDSFKILVAGVALGIAIAIGLGLKDHISRTLQK